MRPTDLVKQRTTGGGRRRQLVPLFRLCSVIVGLCLFSIAFPHLVQACGDRDFFLRAHGPKYARPDDVVVYTVEYKNLGDVPFTDIVLYGPIPEHTSLASASADCQVFEDTIECHIAKLAGGEEGYFEMTLHVDEGAPADAFIHVKVTAVGEKPDQEAKFLDDTCKRTKVVVPQMTVTKDPSQDIVYSEESVTYTYVVANTGNVSLKKVVLVDDKKQSAQVCESVRKLKPGKSFTCTWTTALNGDTTNVATATAVDPWGDVVTDTASAFVNTIQRPQEGGSGIIALDMVASAPAIHAGEMMSYTYTATNASQDLVLDIALTDDQLGLLAPPFDLQAGESATFVTTTVLMTDTTNVATAVGRNLLGDLVSDTASAYVHVAVPDAALSLSLTASAPRVYQGDVVAYTYVVSNTGSGPVYNVVLSDDVVGTIAGPFDLAGGESATFAVSRVLNEDTMNVVTATGEDSVSQSLKATDSVFVDTIQRGEILVLTVTPGAEKVQAGAMVTYTYIVTNQGQDPICQIVVRDDQFGYITNFSSPDGISTQDVPHGFCLQGGASRTAAFALRLDQSTQNTAVATGVDLLMTKVSAQATAFVDVLTIETPQDHVVFLPIVSNNGP